MKDSISFKDFLYFYHWFKNFVQGFYKGKDEHDKWVIKLKYDHTLRVSKEIVDIGRELNLNTEQLFLAKTIGLFHDVGRFPQYEKYHTFRDAKSENHALLSVKTLIEKGILDKLSKNIKNVILKAIEYHNIRILPIGLDPEIDFYSRLIRDADKLDVLNVFVELYDNPSKLTSTIELDLPDCNEVSEKIIEDILANQISNLTYMKCKHDMKLMLLSWTFDINFAPSLKRIKERRYIEKIISHLPPSPKLEEVKKHLLSYVDLKLLKDTE